MSDFDKEAEREKLREKYERDQEKREATEQMSELLLKGATMTNAHCDQCGDPIFRYDGQEFCPTCQEVVTADEADAPETEVDGTQEGTDATAADAGAASSATADGVEPGDDSAGAPTEATQSGQSTDAVDTNGAQPAASSTDPASASPSPPTEPASGSVSPPAPDRQASPESTGGASVDRGVTGDDALGEARASLTRTLLTQARTAENCEDPRRARDHLAAAREAAEALAALSY